MEHLLQYIETIAGRLQAREERTFDWPDADAYTFAFAEKGGLHIKLCGGGECICDEVVLGGELCYFRPGERLSVRNLSESTARFVLIRFHAGGDPCMSEAAYRFRMPLMKEWMAEFIADSAGQKRNQASHYMLQSRLYALASALADAVERRTPQDEDAFDSIERSRRHMEEQYHAMIDIEELAKLSGMSLTRFYQSFRDQVGLPPNKFITAARLNASLGLLGNAAAVAETAHTVGYGDEYYFSRVFKRHMGITPSEYAARANRNIAASPIFEGDLSVLGITPRIVLDKDWAKHSPDKAVELVRRERPDLLLASPLSQELSASLSEWTAVEQICWKGMPWKERLRYIARLLGIPTVAERWLAYFDLLADNAREHVRRRAGGEPFLLVGVGMNGYRIYGMQRKKMRDLFYDELRMTPPKQAEQISFFDVGRLDEIAELDCDNALFFVSAGAPDSLCFELERRWRRIRYSRREKRCLFLRHPGHLAYNAATHESLVGQTVKQLLRGAT